MGYSPGGHQELDMSEQLTFSLLEGMEVINKRYRVSFRVMKML